MAFFVFGCKKNIRMLRIVKNVKIRELTTILLKEIDDESEFFKNDGREKYT